MSNYFIKRRPDANQAAIIEALQKHGVDVIDLSGVSSGVADLATTYKNKVCFIELKHGKAAALKKTQVRFLALYAGYCGIARTEQEALDLATDPVANALTDRQKDKLADFYMKMATDKVHLATIMKELGVEG